jgi:hypothetical protein
MSSFTVLLSKLPEGMRSRILPVLNQGPFANVDELRASVVGKTKVEITSFLVRNLDLGEMDVSALAGLLVAPTGNYIPISQLIILQALTLFLYISHLISPSRCLL